MTDQNSNLKSAFDGLKESISDRAQPADQSRVDELHTALSEGDHEKARGLLETLEHDTLWLYEELMQHPAISLYMQKLSIFGL